MNNDNKGVTVIDLFCGAGGFSEGFHMAGFDVVYGIDNWKPACETHSLNNLGETGNIDLLSVDIDDVLDIKSKLNKKYGEIDIVIGSPPCTEFSYAKKGGRGNIEKGMLLIRKHLLFVSLFKPKYWLMENVPRLKSAIEDESIKHNGPGWFIPYKKIGIPPGRFEELGINSKLLHIPKGGIFTASDYGACQNRKRFIAGNFPIDNMKNHVVPKDFDVSLGKIINSLEKLRTQDNGHVTDPNYPHHQVDIRHLRDYDYDTSLHPMYWEEMRYAKRRAIQYGKMKFPEDMGSPSRTIMATANSSSREALVFDTGKMKFYQGRKRPIFRQPTVREVSCIQGFPLDFQLLASKINDRYKLVGNAVPCRLSYSLALSILDEIDSNKNNITDDEYLNRVNTALSRRKKNRYLPIITNPSKIVAEANDGDNIHNTFKARSNKRIKRKLLSSKLPGDSHIVVFDNSIIDNDKLKGSTEWKVCIHRGVGKGYAKVFMDKISIGIILKGLDRRFTSDEKSIIKELFQRIDEGIPKLKGGWIEFKDFSSSIPYKGYISKDRLELPDIETFQRMFTKDIRKIGNYVGPIDIFDGLDALMLEVLCGHKNMLDSTLCLNSLTDEDIYIDFEASGASRIAGKIKIPLITIFAAFASVYVLNRMYEKAGSGYNVYSRSISEAVAMIKE